ncbi:MAG: DNA-formamidopyrimidine glycosylase family protein [Aquiluna sp.]
MPEGHTVHRIAKRFQKEFLGSALEISSPQGRFTDAELVSGRPLKKSEAWGKQLFLHFDDLAIRIHLGIYGKWRFTKGDTPEVVGQVRARFQVPGITADLRGPTACEVLDGQGVKGVQARLGPDPLRPDRKGHERQRFVEKLTSRKTAVGQQLMDQSVIAGIGNVYRAELLFRAGMNPHTPGTGVPREQAERIWEDSLQLMPIGVRTGLMLTREGYLKGRPKLADRYYVYKREGLPCRECGHEISLEIMATRKLYYCARCQK